MTLKQKYDLGFKVKSYFMILIGTQGIFFSIISRQYAAARGFLPINETVRRLSESATLERVLLGAGLLFAAGLAGFGYSVRVWYAAGFGPLPYGSLVGILMLSGTALTLSVQTAFTAFLSEILKIGH